MVVFDARANLDVELRLHVFEGDADLLDERVACMAKRLGHATDGRRSRTRRRLPFFGVRMAAALLWGLRSSVGLAFRLGGEGAG